MIPKVSIVVPVYNAGEHFARCLASLVNQTLQEIEIILVLDCPTDGSDKVAEQYAQQDARIKLVYNKKNMHIGLSRNEGMKVATGQYLGFSDHDDYCEKDMFELLYAQAVKKKADIVVSNFSQDASGEKIFYGFPNLADDVFKVKIFENIITGKISEKNKDSFSNIGAIWNQLFRRQFLSDHFILFDDNNVITMEDTLFNLKSHFFAQTVTFLPRYLYCHTTNSTNAYDDYAYMCMKKVIPYLELIDEFYEKNNVRELYAGAFFEIVLRKLYTSFRNEIRFKSIYSSFREIKKIRANKVLQSALKDGLKLRYHRPVFSFPLTKQLFFLVCTCFVKTKA